MGGCPRAGTTRSSEMSPAQGRSSLAGTPALASVRVAVPYVTTFRGAGTRPGQGPALSCPFIPRVFSAPERLERQARAGAQPPRRGEPDGQQRRARPRPDGSSGAGAAAWHRAEARAQAVASPCAPPAPQARARAPSTPGPQGSAALGKGCGARAAGTSRDQSVGFQSEPNRQESVGARWVGRAHGGPCVGPGPQAGHCPHFLLGTPKGCVPRPVHIAEASQRHSKASWGRRTLKWPR